MTDKDVSYLKPHFAKIEEALGVTFLLVTRDSSILDFFGGCDLGEEYKTPEQFLEILSRKLDLPIAGEEDTLLVDIAERLHQQGTKAMIKVLILEDNEERMKQFRERFRELGKTHKITHTDNAAEACQMAVDEDHFDYVFIDHDLNDAHYNPDFDGEGTGYDFALFMEANPEVCQKHGTYVVHSLNPMGAQRIQTAIKKGGKRCSRCAFLWNKENFPRFVR